MKSPLHFAACALLMLSSPALHAHPVPESPSWLTFDGAEGPGKGRHVILIAADQEYRSEQAMPMLARILATHHGFDTTVLFGVNEDGLVDPTLPVYPEKGREAEFKKHHIPGLEHLPKADLVIFFTRLLSLPDDQLAHIVAHLDSGKPSIVLRTGNHGFRGRLPYEMDGKPVRFEDIIGGTFLSHHGNWQQDSTRGDIVPEMKNHPVLTGVKDIWGPSDVYRTFKEGTGLPDGCTALVYGQPLIGRERGGADNPNKEPLPVVWTKEWKTSKGASARILHSTMGSARDLQCPGLRRLVINGVYWGIGIEDRITPDRSVDHVGIYEPLSAGFNYEKLGVVPRKPAEYVR